MMLSILAAILLLGSTSIEAVQCGRWYSNPCLGEEDVRYDPNASDNIIDQAPVWGSLQGFWKYQVYAYDPTGRPQEPSATNPKQPFMIGGFPYSYFPATGFMNVTIVGSRIYQHRYLVFAPADATFCALNLTFGFVNVLGNGTCGRTGYSYFTEVFGTSSFDRDGSVSSLPRDSSTSSNTTTTTSGGILRNEEYQSRPMDNQTIYTVAKDKSGSGLSTETLVVLDSTQTKLSSVSEFFVNTGSQVQMVAFFRAEYTRLQDESAFETAVNAAYTESAVPLGPDRVQNGQVPMVTTCLAAAEEDETSCPTESDWCTVDPDCGTSRYQEPVGTMRDGVLTASMISAAVVFIGLFYLFHRFRLGQQKNRYRTDFAKRVAEAIEFSESFYALDPTKLLDEFRLIDPGLASGGEGKVSKAAMKEFMQSGKVGYITESDFGALWAAIDTDQSGYVDFLEFCAFLSQCEHLLQEMDDTTHTHRDRVAKSIAERLSALSRHDVRVRARSVGCGEMFSDDGVSQQHQHQQQAAFPVYDSISLPSTLPTVQNSPTRSPFAAKSLGTGLSS